LNQILFNCIKLVIISIGIAVPKGDRNSCIIGVVHPIAREILGL